MDLGSGPKKSGRAKTIAKWAATIIFAAALGTAALGFGLNAGGLMARKLFTNVFTNDAAIRELTARRAFSFEEDYQRAKARLSSVSYEPLDASEVLAKAAQSVVNISVTLRTGGFSAADEGIPSAASGIIFSEDTDKIYIATNNHVVENASRVILLLDDDTAEISASYSGSDPASDLAVIFVLKEDMDFAKVNYAVAEFGDSGAVSVGDAVLAVGNSMGKGQTATSGIISAVNKEITINGKRFTVIQTDAAINPGNSGGALFNSSGEVIGISNAKVVSYEVEGMGYSIPSNTARDILLNLIEYGLVQKPSLGIIGRTITADMKEMYNLGSVGVYVRSVISGSGAEKAGILPDDIIVGYGGAAIETFEDLANAVSKSAVGDAVIVRVYRNGVEPMEFTTVIGDANVDLNF